MKIGRRFDAVMYASSLELLHTLEGEAARLKGTDARGDHHRARGQSSAGGVAT